VLIRSSIQLQHGVRISQYQMLYKYRIFDSDGYWLKNLSESTLWCSSYDKLNDPSEYQHEIDRHPDDVERVFNYWLEIYPHWRGQLAQWAVPFMAAEMVSDYIKSVGVCCFTTNPTNSQMWAQYAANHAGYCLGFEFPAGRGPFGREDIHPVAYALEAPRVPVTLFARRPYDLFHATIPVLTTKQPDWRHEEEWRYLHQSANVSVQYPSGSLKEVILGSRSGREHRDATIGLFGRAGGTKVKEAIAIPRSYELRIRSLVDDDDDD
jgi:hypothetical protein